jgi:hypothetical protein
MNYLPRSNCVFCFTRMSVLKDGMKNMRIQGLLETGKDHGIYSKDEVSSSADS